MNIIQLFFKSSPQRQNAEMDSLFLFMYNLIKRHDLIEDIWDTYKKINILPEEEQIPTYIRTYRELEQFIVTNVPPVVTQEFTKQSLRGSIHHVIDTKKLPAYLQIFFVSENVEHILLFQLVTKTLVTTIIQNFGMGKLKEILKHIAESNALIAIQITEHGFEFPSLALLPSGTKKEDVDHFLKIIYSTLYSELKSSLGSAIVLNSIRKSFDFIKDAYDTDILRIFFSFIPEDILQVDRQSFFTTEELSKQVNDRTNELNKKLLELEKMNEIMVGRELRMADIKKENEQLKKQIQELTSKSL